MNVVFAIGCKRYSDPDVAQLKYADRDAKRFVETVMGTQDPDNTEQYLLHDEHEYERFRPTRANILYYSTEDRPWLKALKSLEGEAKKDEKWTNVALPPVYEISES